MCNKLFFSLVLSVVCCSAMENLSSEQQDDAGRIRYTREQLLALRDAQVPPFNVPDDVRREVPEEDPQR